MRHLHSTEFFEAAYIPEPNSGCWLWAKATDTSGYGSISVGRTSTKNGNEKAHRFSYRLYKGEIPQGKWVLHKCDVKICVNPDHLFLGGSRENYDDMVAKGRKAKFDYAFAKLSLSDAENIRHLKREGHRINAIARQYGVSHSIISMIVSGRRHTRGDR